jgi:hypothetical protein
MFSPKHSLWFTQRLSGMIRKNRRSVPLQAIDRVCFDTLVATIEKGANEKATRQLGGLFFKGE